MSNDTTPTGEVPPSPASSLQFEKADFSQTAPISCVLCKQPIAGEYFQVNGQSVCAVCRERIDATATQGRSATRMARALGAGLAAALGGFLVYWGIRATTGYEFALVAILVGWMVGSAVRWGSERRGGWAYQLLAVVLTYFSIASTYCPDIVQAMRESRAEEEAAETRAIEGGTRTNESPVLATTGAASPRDPQSEEPLPSGPNEDGVPGWIQWGVAFVFALMAPFLMGLENIIGLLIIAFGLMQAWRLNRKVPLNISGPFSVVPAAGA